MRKARYCAALVSLLLLIFIFFKSWAASGELILKFQPYVVSIKQRAAVAAYGEVASSAGTGFVVDVKKGIIVTNAHVVGAAKVITEYLITLHNGREVEGKLLYLDPWMDFAFLQIDPKNLNLDKDIKFAKENVKVGASILIIGKNENKHFSLQTGTIASPYEISGNLTQQAFRISLNVQGGASGSPVIDSKSEEVIGIIFASNQLTSAFAIPISFILDAVQALQKDQIPHRFHCGEILSYMSLDDLHKFYNFPNEQSENYRKKFPTSFDRALMVSSILEDAPVAQKLEIGDVLLAINGQEIGPDLYVKEKIINEAGSQKQNVKLTIIRNGQTKNIEVKPYDLQSRKITRLLVFGGATFFEADDLITYRTGVKPASVFVTNSRSGSSFMEKLPMFPGTNITAVSIVKINEKQIKCLQDLIDTVKDLMKKEHFNIQYRNYGVKFGFDHQLFFNQELQTEQISVSPHDGLPMLYNFNQITHQWEVKVIE